MRNTDTVKVTIRTVKRCDIDVSMYEYLESLSSELKQMKVTHEAFMRTPDMIGYSLGKAIEYCERTMNEIRVRATGKLK